VFELVEFWSLLVELVLSVELLSIELLEVEFEEVELSAGVGFGNSVIPMMLIMKALDAADGVDEIVMFGPEGARVLLLSEELLEVVVVTAGSTYF